MGEIDVRKKVETVGDLRARLDGVADDMPLLGTYDDGFGRTGRIKIYVDTEPEHGGDPPRQFVICFDWC